MATYVPGASTYFPDFQPFVPDYKFLSGILDVRTDRYNTNYKAVNDLYSKVVYADLSRKDTRDIRDQYANQLAPKLQQVSGMDLSIQQNADSAKALFKPFYDNNLIVKDLVMTNQYRKEAASAENLLASDDRKTREKYWQTGVKALQYQMKDFIDATPEEALPMAIPKYIPDADLYEMSMEILDKAGLKVTQDKAEGGWIIRQTNGSLVTASAYEMVKRELLDDPRVINAYKTDAYVKQRDFVDEGVASKLYATKTQAQEAWANNIISDITKKLAAQLPETKSKTQLAEDSKTNWEQYEKQYGIIPDSDEEKTMLESMAAYDAQIQKQKGQEDIMQEGSQPSPNANILLNKAYNMMMSYNIHDDMVAAAKQYSMRDASITMEANPYKLMEATKATEHRYNMIEKTLDHDNKMLEIAAEAKAKKEADGEVPGSAILDALGIFSGPLEGANTTVDKSKINVIDLNNQYAQERRVESKSAQIDFILTSHQTIESLRKGDPSSITLNTPKGRVKMSLSQARDYLSKPEKSVNVLYKDYSERIDNAQKTNPLLVAKENGALLATLKQQKDKTDALLLKAVSADEIESKVYAENFNKLKQLEQGKELREYEKKGIPMLISKDINGKPKVATEREFIDQYKSRYDAGMITDSKGVALKDKDRTDVFARKGVADMSGTPVGSKGAYFNESPVDFKQRQDTSIKQNAQAVIADAKKLYADQKALLNKAFNGSIASETSSGAKVPSFIPYTREQFYRGLRPEEMTEGNLVTYGAYSTAINPHALKDDPEGVKTIATLNKQYNLTKDAVVFAGTLAGAESAPTASDSGSKAILSQAMLDLRAIVMDPKTPRGTTPNMTIDYFPVYGATKGVKNMAAYVIHLDSDYVKKLQSSGDDTDIMTGLFRGNLGDNNTITMMFPQSTDINSRKMSNYNFSAIDSKIQINGSAKYEAPNGGFVNFYKSGNSWMYNMETQRYDPNTGNFVTEDVIPSTLLVDQNGSPVQLNDLDRAYGEYTKLLDQVSSINIANANSHKQKVLKK